MTLAANLAALARRVVGTGVNNLVSLDAGGKLPAVDGSRLTNLPRSAVQSAEIATTSGTAKDFTAIPSDAKRISVEWAGVSTNGSAHIVLQLGTSAGVETAGYTGSVSQTGGANSTGGYNFNTGALVSVGGTAASVHNGLATFARVGGNKWVMTSIAGRNDINYTTQAGVEKTLADVLDRLRFTTANGTDVFDAGSVSIIWE